jgi:hypothetical protein
VFVTPVTRTADVLCETADAVTPSKTNADASATPALFSRIRPIVTPRLHTELQDRATRRG